MSGLRAFTMPKWGIEMAEGVITQWHVVQDETFTPGQTLLSVETDKIVNDIEAEYEATCLRVLSEVDETYAVGALLAVMGPAGTSDKAIDDFVSGFVPVAPAGDVEGDEEDEQAAEPASTPVTLATATDYALNTHLPVSPAAAAVAQQAAADLSELEGSGSGGRILKQDVEQQIRADSSEVRVQGSVDISVNFGALAEANATPIAKQYATAHKLDLKDVQGSGKGCRIRLSDIAVNAAEPAFKPFTAVQSRIARKLTDAARDIPQFHLEIEVLADPMVAYRTCVDGNISLNHVLLKAVADTLIHHPKINVQVSDEGVQPIADANVAVAVAVETGLMTPVIAAAQRLSLVELAQESNRLMMGARDGTLKLSDYSAGSFTVSNLGMYGINRFTSIINPPQGAILSVGAITSRPVMLEDAVKAAGVMVLTLCCDHRAIDGATGAHFLSDLKARLEQLDAD